MKYHSNLIGSLFGLFGGQKIIAVPDIEDIAGIPEIRIEMLRIIAESDRIMSKVINDPTLLNTAIKVDKIADYQERMLEANGYFTGTVNFADMQQIHEDMVNDWWLKQ